jgi:molybdopterin synthase catalytic subunit
VTESAYFVEGPIPVESLEEGARLEEGLTVVTLQGVVRADRNGAGELDHVVFEAEASRSEEGVAALFRAGGERWPGIRLVFRHRLGSVGVGETSVFLAVGAPRREDALAACRFLAENLKSLPGLLQRDVFRDGSSRPSHSAHEALLLSDDPLSLPQS